MKYNTASIETIAEQLKWYQSKPGYSAVFFIGAGASVTGNIPTAWGIVEEFKKRFKALAASCETENYSDIMALLTPTQRREFLGEFIDRSTVNTAHLYLATLVKHGFVDRVFTTNFDHLITRSLSLMGIHPAVYDFAASQRFIPGEIRKNSVFYLHGQRDGFIQLNTGKELDEHAKKLNTLFQDSLSKRCWIVIGYSGENDPVFEQLSKIETFHEKLFWIGYEKEEPKDHIKEKLLYPERKFAYYVKDYNADRFFRELVRELGIEDFPTISKPLSILKDTLNTIGDSPTHDQTLTTLKDIRYWLDATIKEIENKTGDDTPGDEEKTPGKTVNHDDLKRITKEILGTGNFEQIDEIFDDVKKHGGKQLKEDLSDALYEQGKKYWDFAKKREGDESELLLRKGCESFRQAGDLNSSHDDAFSSLGESYGTLASILEGNEAEAFYKKSFAAFQKAASLKKDDHVLYSNWGKHLIAYAKNIKPQHAETLLNRAFRKFRLALEINRQYHQVLLKWGNGLAFLAGEKKGEESEKLYIQAFEKYRAALEIFPGYYQVLNNWGNKLGDLAKSKEGTEAENLFNQAFEKYQKSVEINPDYSLAYNNWGNKLKQLAQKKEGVESEKLLIEATKKFKLAIRINEKYSTAYRNWAKVERKRAKMKKGEEKQKLLDFSIELLSKADEIETRNQG